MSLKSRRLTFATSEFITPNHRLIIRVLLSAILLIGFTSNGSITNRVLAQSQPDSRDASAERTAAVGALSLRFPLQISATPYNAKITSVLEHFGAFYVKDNTTRAYTGEKGESVYGITGCSGNTCSYKNANGAPFKVNGNYLGWGPRYEYLSYNGHSGYDYAYGKGTVIVAPADGTLYIPNVDPVNSNSGKKSPWCGFHTFYIDHGNGYTTWFLHADRLHESMGNPFPANFCTTTPTAPILVSQVSKGDPIAYSGDFASGIAGGVGDHLHFEVRHNGKVVDPYGWEGAGSDPISSNAKAEYNEDNLWGIAAPIINNTNPTQHAPGSFQLTVNGSNFDNGAVAEIWYESALDGSRASGHFVGQAAIQSRGNGQLVTNVGLGQPGKYLVKVKNASGPRSKPVSLIVTNAPTGDFTVTAAPITQTISQGATASYLVTVKSQNGFSNPVSLSALRLPPGYAVAGTGWGPVSVTPPPNGSVSSTLKIATNASTETNNFIITLKGKSDLLERTTTVSLTVNHSGTANPLVSSINPNPIPTFNNNQSVKVNGSNFQANLKVDVFNGLGSRIGTLSGSQIQGVTANSFTMVISLGSIANEFGIEVVNPDWGRSPRFKFSTVAPNPSVVSISPPSPPVVNGNQTVQVSGKNFQYNLKVDVFNGAGAKLGTLSGSQVQEVTPTSFKMLINLGSVAGSFGIEVVNPSGGRSPRFAFSTQGGNSPAISSISPNPVPTFNNDQEVQVNGSKFQPNLKVDVFNGVGTKLGTLSGTQVQNVTASSFKMLVNFGSTAGNFGIEVVNPDGGRSARFTFTTVAPSPAVNSISPSSPPVVNGNQTVQVNGSNFQYNLKVDVFNGAGTKLGTLSGSQIQEVTPTSFKMLVNLGSAAGNFGIEVVNPSGGRSSRFTFSTKVTKPTVNSISPNPVPAFNNDQDVRVSGSNFQSNLTVDVFNSGGTKLGTLSGSQIQDLNSTSFTMAISLGSTASSFGIEVVNPDGGRSARFTFSTTASSPFINSISPNPVPVINADQSVKVFGGSFQYNLKVDVFNSGGTKLGTLSGSQIKSVTPTSFTMLINLGSTPGSFGIEVVNPSGGRSGRFNFSTN